MTNSQMRRFGSTYSSSLSASREACNELSDFLLASEVECELASQVELCVVEMMNNAFIHAYQEREGLPIELNCEIDSSNPRTLQIAISDYGSTIPKQELDKKLVNTFVEPDPDDESTWNTSGRGFMIVASLMDSVALETDGNKNTFVLVKELAAVSDLECD